MKSLRLLTLAALVAVPQGPQASALVARGIVALHHFEYEDANDAFRQAREADPSYADAMASAYEQFRNDPDVAALYALALLGTMSRGLIGNMSPVMTNDIHDRALAGSATQQRVAAILLEALRAHPQHPGALHYLIH